jgi:hypothetical protein
MTGDEERARRVRELAYRLWEEAGKPEGGRAAEFWVEAERQVEAGADEQVELEVVERKRQADESEE